jgi:uridine phosphorylase
MEQKRISAKQPMHGEAVYHLGIKQGEIPPYVLLPGDVDRAEKIALSWDEQRFLNKRREFVSYVGRYKGCKLGVVSTGIGGPAVSIAVEELARLGVHTFVRVGSCGSVKREIKVGDIVITKAAARFDGASLSYAPLGYPAVSDPEVYRALVEAAQNLGVRYHVGITASFDTFYVGQGRPGFRGYLTRNSATWLEDISSLNISNVEMEAATLLTITNVYGLRGGVVCAVYANRVTDEFGEEGEKDAINVGNEAIKILTERDLKGAKT